MPPSSPDLWALLLGAAAGLVCSFLNTVASSGSAVSLPILMMLGLDPISANATNRIPVLIGAASATASFHKSKAIPWNLALRLGVPGTAGAILGAALAEAIPARDLALVITAAVLLALLLLFTKLKQAIASATPGEVRFGLREIGLFFLIGIWLGFIVLDGATYLLLALVLAVHLPLVAANALKNVALLPTTAAAMAIFSFKGSIDWPLGGAMALGSIAGGVLGARLAISASAKKWVFRLLVTVITAELIHIGVHYAFASWGFGAQIG